MCGNNIELASTWLLENDWQELETAGQQAAFDAIGAPANAEALGGDGVQDDDGDDDDDDAEEVQGVEEALATGGLTPEQLIEVRRSGCVWL